MAQITDQQINSLIYSMRAIYNASSTFLDSIDKFDASFNNATKATNDYGKATKNVIKDFSQLHDSTSGVSVELDEFNKRIRNNRRSIDEAIKALDDYSDTVDTANVLSKQNSKDLKNLTDVFQLSASNISSNAQAQLKALNSITSNGSKELLSNIIQSNSMLGNQLSEMTMDTNKKINDSILNNQQSVSASLNKMFNVLGDTQRIKEYVEAKDKLLYELSKTPDTKLASDDMRELADKVVALGKEIGIATNITNKYGKNISVLEELSKVSLTGGQVSPEILSALNINADKIDSSLGRFGEILITLSQKLDNPDVSSNYTKLYKSLNTFFMDYSAELKQMNVDNVLKDDAFLKAIKEDKNTLLQLKKLAGIGESIENGNLSNKQIIKELEKLQSVSTAQSNPIVQQLIENAKGSLNLYDFNKSMQKFVLDLSKENMDVDKIITDINKLAAKKESAKIASTDFDKLSQFVIESNKLPEILLKSIGDLLVDTKGVITDNVKTVIDQLYDINKHVPISSKEFEAFNTQYEKILLKSNNDIAQVIRDTSGFEQTSASPTDPRLDKVFSEALAKELKDITTSINQEENIAILKSINAELKKTKKLSGEELKIPFEALANRLSETIKQATDVSDTSHIAANVTLIKEMGKTFALSFGNIVDTIDQNTSGWKEMPDMVASNFGKYMREASGISLEQDVNGEIIDKQFKNYENMVASIEDFNRKMRDTLITFEQNNNEINADNYKIVEDLVKSAEDLGLSNHQNIVDLKNILGNFDPNRPSATVQTVSNVEELKKIPKDFISAFSKVEKKIKQDNIDHAAAFSTIFTNHMSDQKGTLGKFIYDWSRFSLSGNQQGVTDSINEFNLSLRRAIIPAVQGIIDNSKGFIKRETDAFADFIKLDRSTALDLQMGEADTLKSLADTKPIWQTMEGGIDEFNRYQLDLLDTAKLTLGTNVEQRNAIENANLENLRALGLLSSKVEESANETLLKSMMVDMQKISAAGGYGVKAQSDILNNVVKSSAFLKSSAMLDKEKKRAQYEEIQNTIKFASVLKMTTEQATSVASALASINTNVTQQQMIENVGAFMQMKGIADEFGRAVGMSSGISDEKMNEMITILQHKNPTTLEKQEIRDTMYQLIANLKDEELAYQSKMDEAKARGDSATAEEYNRTIARLDDIITMSIDRYSGPVKDIVQKFAESYPTSKEEYAKIEKSRKNGETFQQAMIRAVDEKTKKQIDDQKTTVNNFEKAVTDFGNSVTAFGGNIFGSQVSNVGSTAVGAAGSVVSAVADVAEVGLLSRILTGGAEGGLLAGLVNFAKNPWVIGGLLAAGGAYGYFSQSGDMKKPESPTKMVEPEKQSVKPEDINNTAGPEKKTTPEGYAYKAYPSTTVSPPSSGLNINPPNGNNGTTIVQSPNQLPSDKINNADISLALEDLKTFLRNEMIKGLMDHMNNIANNTGNTAKNTSNDGVLGGLVEALTKPTYQPYQRGPVEKSSTVTG
jgi:hypothetical protein